MTRSSSSDAIEPIAWLLAGDAAIRWQTMQDLTDSSARTVQRERQKVAQDGWGARLLAQQQRTGTWATTQSADGGLYTPKWTSTTYTMLLLRDFGLAPNADAVRSACTALLDRGLQPDGGIAYGAWAKRSRRGETCITGMVLSILAYFRHDDPRLETISEHLLAQQMPDGGWNCRRPAGATHSSMHTTISVLEGLHLFELHCRRGISAVRQAQQRGREFLLLHRLFRSHRTGKVIKSEFTRLSFPPRWHYDILRALDHFRAVNAPKDDRLAEAVEIIRRRRGKDGRWTLEYTYPGKTYFTLERIGVPSRWNTLRALRVLRWWDGDRSTRISNRRRA